MDYFDILLAKKLSGGGGGDIDVETLNATENGTYNAGAGKAYNPVVVAVPEPTLIAKSISQNGTYNASDDNADGYSSVTVDVEGYQIKNIANVPTDIASFTDGTDLPMPKLEVGIEAVQDLHGYDAPWPAGSGKNKIDCTVRAETTVANIKSEVKANNRIVASGVSNGNGDINIGLNNTLNIANGQTITISLSGTDTRDGTVTIFFHTSTYINIGSISSSAHSFTYTASADLAVDEIKLRNSNGRTVNIDANLQVEFNSSASSFAPYSNECPISGWSAVKVTRTGKNLWGGEKLADDIVAKVPNATKDTTNKTVTYTSSQVSNKVLFDNFKGNTQYTFYMSTENSYTNLRIWYSDGTNQIIQPNTVVVTQSSKTVDRLAGIYSAGSTALKYDECGIYEGAITVQDFKPYNGTTYPISWQDEAETIYKGYVDYERKKVVATHKKIDLSTLTYTTTSWGAYRASLADSYTGASTVMPDAIASKYEVDTYQHLNQSTPSDRFALNSKNVYIVASESPTGELLYPLETPIEYNLDEPVPTIKTLLGNNNLWADSGQIISGQYFAEL